MALSDKERHQIEIDERVDAAEDESRKYKGDGLVDVVFALPDLLLGDQSTTEHAREKTEYYNELRASRNDR